MRDHVYNYMRARTTSPTQHAEKTTGELLESPRIVEQYLQDWQDIDALKITEAATETVRDPKTQ